MTETAECSICKRPMDDPADPTTANCGGDCLRCMAEIGEDPGCIAAMKDVTNGHDLNAALVKHLETILEPFGVPVIGAHYIKDVTDEQQS